MPQGQPSRTAWQDIIERLRELARRKPRKK